MTWWMGFALLMLGLFIGSNLGVALMCVLACASPSADIEEEAADDE